MSLKWVIVIISFGFLHIAKAQNTVLPVIKNTYAIRITSPPTIDGSLDEEVWKAVRCPATDFIQRSPRPGASPSKPTEVRVLYDDHSIYVGATLYDVSADSIMREFTQRDDFGFTDIFGVYFDTYDDDINAFEFLVTAAGVQIDRRITAMGSDRSWNAAWMSEVKIDSGNWYVEMEIPLSAVRFPKKPFQEWGVNFRRTIRRKNEHDYWNKVDPQVNGFVNQFGLMSGITNIKSPLRLSISPYVSVYHDRYVATEDDPASVNTRFNGGMDVRYGINDAFTLDMILVPDFGQVVSDNRVLNLSPFEVRYAENRQFFKEGTDLFDKGGFFYSRRVGGRPLDYGAVDDTLTDSEDIASNPQEGRLINATKVSGRTASGFGLGVFNAITGTTYATIRNRETGETREYLTDPLTNYSIIALDQNLKNNSYVSLINTTVWRQGSYYDANLTGTAFSISNQGNRYTVSGRGAVSQKYGLEEGDAFGYTSSISLSKTSGNLRASLTNYIESDTYDPNDLGYLRANNEVRTSANVGYNIYEPFWKLLNLYTDFDVTYRRLYSPSVFTDANFALRANATFRSFNSFRLQYQTSPTQRYDYFEPRVDGRFVKEFAYHSIEGSFDTDSRKRLALGSYAEFIDFNFKDQKKYRFSLSPRFRVNDRLSFSGSASYENEFSEIGFVHKKEVDQGYLITLGRRNVTTVSNIFNIKYTFTNLMGLTFRARHYWSSAQYREFYTLGEDGSLLASDYQENEDRNYNAFNIDMVYSYTFAPASELSIVWKNSIITDEESLREGYFSNADQILSIPKNNSISLRLLYFIDYAMLKKQLSKN